MSGFGGGTLDTYDYEPMELAPNWSRDNSGTEATNTMLRACAGANDTDVIRMLRMNNTLDATVTLDGVFFADGYIEGVLLYASATQYSAAFVMCMRVIDAENSIGIRTYQGNLQVYERSGGVWSPPILTPNPPVGTLVKLQCIGNTVELYFDDVLESSNPVISSSTGGVGVIARAWQIADADVIGNLTAVPL
jgi:hypothetical protein